MEPRASTQGGGQTAPRLDVNCLGRQVGLALTSYGVKLRGCDECCEPSCEAGADRGCPTAAAAVTDEAMEVAFSTGFPACAGVPPPEALPIPSI